MLDINYIPFCPCCSWQHQQHCYHTYWCYPRIELQLCFCVFSPILSSFTMLTFILLSSFLTHTKKSLQQLRIDKKSVSCLPLISITENWGANWTRNICAIELKVTEMHEFDIKIISAVYHVGNISSCQISKVKQHWARSVHGWVTVQT
jgi:hypothetical protein